MPRFASSRLRAAALAVLLAGLAWMAVPFSPTPRTVLVPGVAELDAILGTLLVAEGGDTLLRQPTRIHDLSILYPDHHQRRTLEPFLGYIAAGLPLRAAGISDTRIFEALRWLVVFGSLVAAWRLLVWLGCDAALALAGAGIAVMSPSLMHGIERPQVLAIGLAPALVYHAARTTRGHAVALAAWIVCYPLLGMYNAIAVMVAAIITWPLIVRAAVARWRAGRATRVLVALAVAVAAEAVLLWPWLSDRSDLAGYLDPAFLAIKHWNALDLPGDTAPVSDFIAASLGSGWLIAAGAAVLAWATARRAPSSSSLIVAMPVVTAAAIVAWRVWAPASTVPTWLSVWYQASGVAALAAIWWRLWTSELTDAGARARAAAFAAAGLAVCFGQLAFGPEAPGNTNPLATRWAAWMTAALPPLASVREFHRFWAAAMLCGALALVLGLSRRLASAPRWAPAALAAIVLVGTAVDLAGRPLSPTSEIAAPPEFAALRATPNGTGPVYIHPLMRWDARSCLLMMQAARELHRPLVNGCLGLIPPYFPAATAALHRFPDREALWLLRRWRVDTVLDLDASRPADPADGVHRLGGSADATVWMVTSDTEPHPSAPVPVPGATAHAVTVPGVQAPIAVDVPGGQRVIAVDIQLSMRRAVLNPVPAAFTVRQGATILNAGRSGEWVQSLAAEAFVRRADAVVRITLRTPTAGPLTVAWDGETAPIAGITLWIAQ